MSTFGWPAMVTMPRALRMFEVAVAAPRPRQVPAGRLYQLDRVTDLHCNGWVSRGIAMVNAVRA